MPLTTPVQRVLSGYAFDPGFSARLSTYIVNTVKYRIRWEELKPGPVGEYVEVLDFDPASGRWYAPVDLNDPAALADHGLPPSEGNPQFHQQLVYAVAMKTIGHFEDGLGRRLIWHPYFTESKKEEPRWRQVDGRYQYREKYVPRLRIYPHGLRARNAYFSPDKAAVLLGYFPAIRQVVGNNFPGGAVFTCLSPDIVAHEVTHAILNAVHPRYIEDTNRDVLAFHEGFADLIALFQRFTFPEVVEHQIASARGDLGGYTLLGELATEFGEAMSGKRGALRSAIGHYETKDKWVKDDPKPQLYAQATEVHDRGAVLVSTVFDAFLRLYQHETRDLVRIATGGTGRLPEGDLHPDLVKRMAAEACQLAERFLHIIVRALDYSPPMDITFGDFLRALITADLDLMPSQEHSACRIALIEAFRDWGIYPEKINSLSVTSLPWHLPSPKLRDMTRQVMGSGQWGESLWPKFSELCTRQSKREDLYDRARELRGEVHQGFADYLFHTDADRTRELYELGMIERPGLIEELEATPEAQDAKLNPDTRRQAQRDRFELHSLEAALRVSRAGGQQFQLIVTLHQRIVWDPPDARPFIFRGGATLVFDLNQRELMYVVRKRISRVDRFVKQVRYQLLGDASEWALASPYGSQTEPFALTHGGLMQ